MKKVISSMMIAGMLIFGMTTASAQPAPSDSLSETEMVTDSNGMEEVVNSATEENETPVAFNESGEEAEEEPLGFASVLKQYFIIGDPRFMGIVLIVLIIGLALCIERIVYLNLSSINTKKFINDVEAAIQSGGVEEAKELCRNTRGPVASIYYQGLDRSSEGIEAVEKSVVSYGGVQMGLLEKGVSWISLFIALAPMLGFMGTVIGMIQAFAKIVADGQVSPTTVAGGIQVALLTTVFGLIAAIVLQVFYNYIISKVDGLVNDMENASITLVDIMLKHKITGK